MPLRRPRSEPDPDMERDRRDKAEDDQKLRLRRLIALDVDLVWRAD